MRIVLLPGACAVAGVVFWLAVAIEACSPKPPAPGHQEAGPSEAAPPAMYTKAIVSNMTDAAVNVGVGFGADSVVKSWSFCDASGCLFPLAAGTSMELPTNGGQYLNVALSFGGPPQCGYTAGEFTANNANGYGTADISLVNGFNASVEIQISPGPDGGPIVLGPAVLAVVAAHFGYTVLGRPSVAWAGKGDRRAAPCYV